MAIHGHRSSAQEEFAVDTTVVHFIGCRGVLDTRTVESIQSRLFALADEPEPSDLILDFANIEYVAGRALGMLLVLRNRVRHARRRLQIRGAGPSVMEVFKAAHLEQLFELAPPDDRGADERASAMTILWPEGRSGSGRAVFILAIHTRLPRLESTLPRWFQATQIVAGVVRDGPGGAQRVRRHRPRWRRGNE